MKLEIERMNHTGDGITKIDNVTTFVPKTIPGDIIEVLEQNIVHYKNYNQIFKYQLLKPSNKRITIPCSIYEYCGGCHLMALSYENQLIYKKEKVINIFKKYANLDINPQIFKTTPYHYRNKITLQVKNGKIGLFSKDTQTLIPLKKCLLISNHLNQIISIIQEHINLNDVSQIILKEMNEEIMVQFIGNVEHIKIKKVLQDKVSAIYINNNYILGKKYIQEQLEKYIFKVSTASFFQINREGAIILYNKVKEFLGKNQKNVLDLYCGTGTIGIFVSEYCQKITGIEINESAIEDAKKNIVINHVKNMQVLKGDVGSLLKSNETYDAIIVDPPRSGLDKKTKEILLKIKAPKIIYVSCNPMTLVRDINILKEIYDLKTIDLVDMFPNSYHIECVSLLCLK